VQLAGSGPVMLLLHGTGASTHTWRDLLPLLADHWTVIAPDLPGHGFTDVPPPSGLSLNGMAIGVARLCEALKIVPDYAIGHSAGAAILARQCLDRRLSLQRLISLNGALLPFPGISGHLFGPLARIMALTSFVPQLFAWHVRTDRGLIPRMLAETGSRIDRRGIEGYRLLAGNVVHVRATLDMMAKWDLHTLDAQLGRLQTPVLLVTGDRDHTVPPRKARQAAGMLPNAELRVLPGLGHLAHEEAPAQVARLISEELAAPPSS
jgi:magnesium chelatase accessory protein